MRWQGNLFQMKDQDKTPEKPSDVEIGSLPEEFRLTVVKVIQYTVTGMKHTGRDQ